MADDKSKRGQADRRRINVEEDYEVRYWTKELDISAEELTRLVLQHGNSVEKIRAALGR
jgi:hypothetical protein